MNNEIRQRIKQVQHGEVPDGYQMSKAGIIPMQWQSDQLGKYVKSYDELSNDVEHLPIVTSSRQGLLLQSEYYTEERKAEKGKGYHVVPRGYVTYRHMSDDHIFRFNINTIADKVLVSPEYPVFCATEKMNLSLLVLHLNTSRQFESYCQAQKKGSTRTRMYFNNLRQYILPVPPIAEQQKIAEILAQCDKVITLKQELLDEKRKQEKWLIQKLLKKQATWEKTTIGKLTTICSGATPSTTEQRYWSGDIRWMSSGELNLKQVYEVQGRISEDGLNNSGTKMLPENCVLVGLAGQGKTRGTVAINHVPLCTNQSIAAILPCDKFVTEFMFWNLENRYMELRKLSSGDGARGGLNLDLIGSLIVYLPPVYEQKRIANVLSTAEKEIYLLEQELAAWKEKKKGLAQLLLTGIVRV